MLNIGALIEILTMNVCQFQKDRDEQACCKFIRILWMNTRIVIDGVVKRTVLHSPGFPITRSYFLFSPNLLNMHSYWTYISRIQWNSPEANFAWNFKVIHEEAANPGPQMRRRGPRWAGATNRKAPRQRLNSTPTLDSLFNWNKSKFRMLYQHQKVNVARNRTHCKNTPDKLKTWLDFREWHIPQPNHSAHTARRLRADCQTVHMWPA